MDSPAQMGCNFIMKTFDNQKLKNIYKDINGCFIILTLEINSVPMFLCNLYVPNVDDLDFFKTLTVHMDALELENIIMDGNFNFIVTNPLDCLNRYSNNWKMRNYFVDWTKNKCLVDVLRFMNPESRKYIWFRRTLNLMASRLGMFWISHNFFAVIPSKLY